jgi:hypothetical protein
MSSQNDQSLDNKDGQQKEQQLLKNDEESRDSTAHSGVSVEDEDDQDADDFDDEEEHDEEEENDDDVDAEENGAHDATPTEVNGNSKV